MLFVIYFLWTKVLLTNYLLTTCHRLCKLHFSTPKISDFLILNWGGRLTRTKNLIDCGLSLQLHAEKFLVNNLRKWNLFSNASSMSVHLKLGKQTVRIQAGWNSRTIIFYLHLTSWQHNGSIKKGKSQSGDYFFRQE